MLQQVTGTQGIAAAARKAQAAYERMETPDVTIDDVRSAAAASPRTFTVLLYSTQRH